MQGNILVIGAGGQIGTELTATLRGLYGDEKVIAADIHESESPFEKLDILDKKRFNEILDKYNIAEVYHLAAMLSANAEKYPDKAWKLNMESLFIVLNAAKEGKIKKIFWPSSIAVFGKTTPKVKTPQYTIIEPNTVYGMSKLAGERWCEYYHNRHKVDVRSIRYPGLISYSAMPGGGTTDYAVDIFIQAIKENKYECFLSKETTLPMMYMPDAIRATIEIMQQPAEKIKIRSSYNIAGMSFDPQTLAQEIRKHLNTFCISYKPDFRQAIADSWPCSINDNKAKEDWGWKPNCTINNMAEDMLKNLKNKRK